MSKTVPFLKKHPLTQGISWMKDPVNYMETAFKDYPDLFVTDGIGEGGPVVFVHHPEAVQQILTGDRQNLIAPGKPHLLRPVIGSNSMIGLNGNDHKKRRKLLMPAFHGERMHAYGHLVYNLTSQTFERLNSGEVFTGMTMCKEISLQVILEAIYGLGDSERSQKLRPLIAKIANVFHSPINVIFLFFPWLQQDLGAWSPWGRFLRLRNSTDQAIYEEIEARRSAPDVTRQDILSLLMTIKDEAGNSLTLPELRDELMGLTIAGYETTAIAMSWALYWIHHLPRVKRKLLAEIDSLGESPDPMEIANLPYLDAVCKETLRIYPVGILTLPRVVQEPTEVLEYKLEPGQVAAGCIYLLHQREDIYPNPKEFRPERFLEREFSPFEFIAFGGGLRRCMGQALAQFEIKLVIATILMNYDLDLADHRPEVLTRKGVRLGPSRGVQMIFKGKRNK